MASAVLLTFLFLFSIFYIFSITHKLSSFWNFETVCLYFIIPIQFYLVPSHINSIFYLVPRVFFTGTSLYLFSFISWLPNKLSYRLGRWIYIFRNLLIASADPNLHGEFDVPQMECLLAVGLWWANPDSKTRPSIRQVIKVLNFEAPFPILPPQIPVLNNLPPTTNMLVFTASP